MKFETAKTLVAERLRSRQLSLHGVLDLQWRVKSVDAEGEDAWWDMPIPGGEDADAQCMTIGMLLDVFDSIVADDADALKGVTLLNLAHCFLYDSDVPLLTDLFAFKMLPNCKTLILHNSRLRSVSVAELLVLLSYLDVLDVSGTELSLAVMREDMFEALVAQGQLYKYVWANGPNALACEEWTTVVPDAGDLRKVVWDTHTSYFQMLRDKGLFETVGEDYDVGYRPLQRADLPPHIANNLVSYAESRRPFTLELSRP